MADTPTRTDEPAAPDTPPVQLLEDPVPARDGIRHGADRALVPWSAVRAAVAAEVGEPEGVRTVVFDLLVEQPGRRRILRLDAEPGADAMVLAGAIARGVATGTKLPSIESLAADGIPARWYPDLDSFEEARAELLARR